MGKKWQKTDEIACSRLRDSGEKSRASYFRFARFNTSALYYLTAWHRLGVRRHKQSASEASRAVGWGAERAADLPPSFPLRRLPTGSLRSPICCCCFFFCAFYLDFQKSPSSDYSVGCYLLPTVIDEGTFLSMAPAGAYQSLTVRDLTFATKPTFLFSWREMGEGRGGLFTLQASGLTGEKLKRAREGNLIMEG